MRAIVVPCFIFQNILNFAYKKKNNNVNINRTSFFPIVFEYLLFCYQLKYKQKHMQLLLYFKFYYKLFFVDIGEITLTTFKFSEKFHNYMIIFKNYELNMI